MASRRKSGLVDVILRLLKKVVAKSVKSNAGPGNALELGVIWSEGEFPLYLTITSLVLSEFLTDFDYTINYWVLVDS